MVFILYTATPLRCSIKCGCLIDMIRICTIKRNTADMKYRKTEEKVSCLDEYHKY